MLVVRFHDGNLSVPLPKSIADRLGIRTGDRMVASLDGNRLVFERVVPDLILIPEVRDNLWQIIHRHQGVLDRLAAADAGTDVRR